MSNAGRKHLNGLAAGKGDYANRHTVTLPDCFSNIVKSIGGPKRNFAKSIRLVIYQLALSMPDLPEETLAEMEKVVIADTPKK